MGERRAGGRAGRGRAPPRRVHWKGPRSPRRPQPRREPSRLGLTERAPGGRPGRSRRFGRGARRLPLPGTFPARRATGCRCPLWAPAQPSCPTMARTLVDGPGLGVSTRAASQFGAVFEWRKGAVLVARVLLVAPWRSRAKLSVTCWREWSWWKGEEFGPTRFTGSSEGRPVTSRIVLVSRSPLPTPLSPLS